MADRARWENQALKARRASEKSYGFAPPDKLKNPLAIARVGWHIYLERRPSAGTALYAIDRVRLGKGYKVSTHEIYDYDTLVELVTGQEYDRRAKILELDGKMTLVCGKYSNNGFTDIELSLAMEPLTDGELSAVAAEMARYWAREAIDGSSSDFDQCNGMRA